MLLVLGLYYDFQMEKSLNEHHVTYTPINISVFLYLNNVTNVFKNIASP
jgi:hypothetical protein